MPKRRYECREPTHDWQEIRSLLKDSAQISYEILRPVLLWGQTPQERGAETGMSPRTIYYRANLFDQAGMASVLSPAPAPPVPKQDKRELPPPMRQEIVNLHTEYPALAFFAVFYAAVRKYGVPEVLVSDSGSVFTSHETRRVCEQPGIEKREIKIGPILPFGDANTEVVCL